jgi:hypothetical protein
VIDRPVIVLGSPRSGTTLLFRCLAVHADLWHLPRESHAIFEGPFHPAAGGYKSNRVTAEDLTDRVAESLRTSFRRKALNLNRVLSDPGILMRGSSLLGRAASRMGTSFLGAASRVRGGRDAPFRLLEKTPRNTLRVPMLEKLFPDALYLVVRRPAVENVDSLIRGWKATDWFGPIRLDRFARAGYPIAGPLGIEDYDGDRWRFALVPEWRALGGGTLADVAAWQYLQCERYLDLDLAVVEPSRVFSVSLPSFVEEPVGRVGEILEWAGLPRSSTVLRFAGSLPRINTLDETRRLRYEVDAERALNRHAGRETPLVER